MPFGSVDSMTIDERKTACLHFRLYAREGNAVIENMSDQSRRLCVRLTRYFVKLQVGTQSDIFSMTAFPFRRWLLER